MGSNDPKTLMIPLGIESITEAFIRSYYLYTVGAFSGHNYRNAADDTVPLWLIAEWNVKRWRMMMVYVVWWNAWCIRRRWFQIPHVNRRNKYAFIVQHKTNYHLCIAFAFSQYSRQMVHYHQTKN